MANTLALTDGKEMRQQPALRVPRHLTGIPPGRPEPVLQLLQFPVVRIPAVLGMMIAASKLAQRSHHGSVTPQNQEALMRTMTTVLAASLLSFQGIALAQESGTQSAQDPRPEQEREGIPATNHQARTMDDIKSDRFSELDEDGDGSISREEAEAETKLTDNWSTYDEDGDGSLNPQEYSGFEGTSASGDTDGML